jgi:N-acetylglucosamine-6-phosphate deacetylase
MIYEGIHHRTMKAIRVQVDRGLIESVEEASTAPHGTTAEELPYICAGFIDLQINGYAGIDYSGSGLETASIEALIRAIAVSGTVKHLATIITGPSARISANCRAIFTAVKANPLVRAAVAGIHIEGPFISPEDGPRGAHDRAYVRNPDYGEFREWQDAAGGMIRILTLAPELEGALAFIERVTADGVIVAIGHTAAAPERIRDAVKAGARLSTHLGNGSHKMLPRLNNYLWEQAGEDSLSASIIADGFHLPDSVLRVFARAKGLERLILVSDVAFLAGSSPGIASWGAISVEVHPDGHLSLAGTEFLAGSGHLLDRCVARFVAATGIPVQEAVELCTATPACLIGLPESAIEFVPGEPACLTRFRCAPGAERLAIETCVIAGEEMRVDGA